MDLYECSSNVIQWSQSKGGKVYRKLQKVKKKSSASQRKFKWCCDSYLELSSSLCQGFDILAKDELHQDSTRTEFDVEFGEADRIFYSDNCEVDTYIEKCKRKRWNGSVDLSWQRKARKRKEKMEKSLEFKRQRQLRVESDQKKLEDMKHESSKMEVSSIISEGGEDEKESDI